MGQVGRPGKRECSPCMGPGRQRASSEIPCARLGVESARGPWTLGLGVYPDEKWALSGALCAQRGEMRVFISRGCLPPRPAGRGQAAAAARGAAAASAAVAAATAGKQPARARPGQGERYRGPAAGQGGGGCGGNGGGARHASRGGSGEPGDPFIWGAGPLSWQLLQPAGCRSDTRSNIRRNVARRAR